MISWQTELLRLTLFSASLVPSEDGAVWWRAITGEEPEVSQTDHRERVSREVGPIFDNTCSLELQRRTNRVDWILTPYVVPDQIIVGLPSAGPFVESVETFKALIFPWLADIAWAKRLAFGAALLSNVPSIDAGHAELQQYLPGTHINLKGTRDFLLQLNRPRASTTHPSLELNRLSKWSVASITGVSFGINSALAKSEVKQTGSSIFAARLELDLSTPRLEGGPLDNILQLAEELTALASEISVRGDVP